MFMLNAEFLTSSGLLMGANALPICDSTSSG
jgi:hypothetical protein